MVRIGELTQRPDGRPTLSGWSRRASKVQGFDLRAGLAFCPKLASPSHGAATTVCRSEMRSLMSLIRSKGGFRPVARTFLHRCAGTVLPVKRHAAKSRVESSPVAHDGVHQVDEFVHRGQRSRLLGLAGAFRASLSQKGQGFGVLPLALALWRLFDLRRR